MIDFWNNRYAEPDFAYGEEPNQFFREELQHLKPGKLLLPAEGEGRNAVFAARLGWEVTAFDMSVEGKKKAERLAEKYQVKINYVVCDFMNFETADNEFDCIAFIFFHPHPNFRKQFHQMGMKWLKPGGKLIFQGFSKEQINEKSGGPQNESMLFSIEELQNDFQPLSTIHLQPNTVLLNEGKYHQGMAKVINCTGIK